MYKRYFTSGAGKKRAFTLAEVLITLTIIGIIAAISIPSLLVNVNEKAWDTQRKALYARMSQAMSMLPKLNGYGLTDGDGNARGDAAILEIAAESFITEGLATVYKTSATCTSLSECDFPVTFYALGGGTQISTAEISSLHNLNSLMNEYTPEAGSTTVAATFEVPNTKAAAFETLNGEVIAVYYNPYCTLDTTANDHYVQEKVCVNMIYDLNGSKSPNVIGKDMGFITVLYRSDPVVVAPMPYTSNASISSTYDNASAACKAQDTDYRLPDRNELVSMFVNKTLLDIANSGFWSGSAISAGANGLAWGQSFLNGARFRTTRTEAFNVRCVKK